MSGEHDEATKKLMNEVRKMYDNSFPDHKKAWRHLVKATELVGWKDMYFMILNLQKETNFSKGYRVRKNPNL